MKNSIVYLNVISIFGEQLKQIEIMKALERLYDKISNFLFGGEIMCRRWKITIGLKIRQR